MQFIIPSITSGDVIRLVTIGLRLVSYWWPTTTRRLSRTVMKIWSLKKCWGHHLDLLGSRDIIGHVTIQLHVWGFPQVVNGDHVSTWQAGMGIEIFSLKDIGGHVTSSVTWPLNSSCVVFYWWSIVTLRLSCTVKTTSDNRQSWPTFGAWFSFQRQLADEMYDQQITYLSSNQRRTHIVRFLCRFAVKNKAT